MNPHPTRVEEVTHPLRTPNGEVIYEMIGRPAEHGGAVQHSLAHIILPPGKGSLEHHHQICEETYYILRGQARMLLGGVETLLGPGQAVLILPGQRHQVSNPGPGDLEFLAVCAPAWYPEDSYY